MAGALDKCKKLSIDPATLYLAGLIDDMTARLNACCPPPAPLKAGEAPTAKAATPADHNPSKD